MEAAKILIVEDDPVTVMYLQEMLELRGYRVVGSAPDGPDAIALAGRERPDLILMDVMLEGAMDGIETAMNIQSRFHIPVVYLTASTDEKNLRRAQETDPYGYLIKPIKDYDLYSALETALTRHRLEKKIKESEAFMSGLMNSVPVAVIVINLDGSVSYVNRAFESLTGFESGEVVGVRPPYPWRPERGGDASTGAGAIGRNEEQVRKKNGEKITVVVSAVPVSRGDELLYYLVSWEDVTLRRRLEEQILDISERERISIGRDLHDGIGQDLTAVGYLMGVLAKKVREGQLPGETETEAVINQLDHAKTHIRLLAKGLSPVIVDQNGITIAIDELCRSAEGIYKIRCEADCDDIVIRDASKATHIYYIVQESLNNAVKHGKCKNIRVVLKRRGKGLFLSVIDDGTGLPEETGRREGLGLMFMKYRADIIGGVLNVNRRKPSGTIVTCMIHRID
ncbi:MAG TPA: response regulator [Spirochaetota bacterium]|nr:response regulator [Spirochaetota bacterium]